MKLNELVSWLDNKLALSMWSGDKSNNGLQVEGKAEVTKVAVGVDASLRLFEAAAAQKADFIFVHHGISWGAEPRRFTGSTAGRLKCLFENNMSLYAAHLPLDAHPQSGNNAELCRIANMHDLVPFCRYDGGDIGFIGTLERSMTAAELAAVYEKALPAKAGIFDPAGRKVRKIAVVSGGGGIDALLSASAAGADLLLTGEFDQMMYYPALENNMPVIYLGHYASETTGVKAILSEIKKLGIDGEFIDLPTGL